MDKQVSYERQSCSVHIAPSGSPRGTQERQPYSRHNRQAQPRQRGRRHSTLSQCARDFRTSSLAGRLSQSVTDNQHLLVAKSSVFWHWCQDCSLQLHSKFVSNLLPLTARHVTITSQDTLFSSNHSISDKNAHKHADTPVKLPF